MSARDRQTTAPEVLAARGVFIVTVLALAVFGLVMVYSASAPRAIVHLDDGTYYVFRQARFIGLGIALAAIVALVDYRRLRGVLAWALWLLGMGLLAATRLVGHEGELGGQRWLEVAGVSIQPSEFAKIAVVIVIAAILCDWYERRLDHQQMWIRVGIAVVPMIVLVFAQPDFGSTLLILGTVLAVLWVGGINGRTFAALLGGVGLFGVVGAVAAPYRVARLLGMNPWKDPLKTGYQAINGFYAFASGGIQGVGLGLSRQKFFYLPEAHTDFIFAVIGEEWGLIGTLAVVIGFVLLVWSGLQIARHAPDRFGRIIAIGVTVSLGMQALLNIGSVIGLLPVTGKTLPFISSGGSSMIASMIAAGVILSVSLRSGTTRTEARRERIHVVEGRRR